MSTAPLRITFLRTSCLLIEYGGWRLLTDPWFQMDMRGLPVFRAPGIGLDQLPPLNAIVASHLHRDHFDRDAVARMAQNQPGGGLQVVGTVGTAPFCAKVDGLGAIHEMRPWDELRLGPFRFTATPAEHTGPPPPEVNFVIECFPEGAGVGPPEWTVFFGGDARWSDAYRQIGDRFGALDVAILPIGGTLIFGTRTTMAPRDAVRALNYLRPRWAIPIHEGGEWLPVPPASWHPGRNRHFVRELALSGLPVSPCVLAPGEAGTFDADGLSRLVWRSNA